MRDPREHAENRNFVETILRYIPGFRGYLEKEYRREADEMQRDWLADRLQHGKQGLDDFMRQLTEDGLLDALPQCERLRHRLDKLIGRIRSAMQGYSGVFDLVRIDEEVLERVYEHDASLVTDVDALAKAVQSLGPKPDAPVVMIPQLLAKVDALENAWDKREGILQGME